MIGVVMVKNFYMSGTLKDNILRKIQATDEEVDKYIKMLKLDEDIEDYDLYGLDSPIRFENNRVNNEITKKLAFGGLKKKSNLHKEKNANQGKRVVVLHGNAGP